MALRKSKPIEGQVGFSDLDSDFEVPVVMRPKRGRTPTPTSALDLTKRPQTWLKLLSLEAYLPVWFGKISNKGDEAYYLDFFAGPGLYVNGLLTAKGSPVLACEAAAGIIKLQKARGRTWTPHLRFVEPDDEARATLKTELTRFDGDLDCEVIDGEAAQVLPRLLAESAGHPTLAFFDPFGYDVAFEWLLAFDRPGINEVLVSFDAQGIKRNIAAGQTVGVTEFSGGDWWRSYLDGTEFDLPAYLYDLARRLRRQFPYAGVQQFEYLSNHAYRAVAQCCGSVVGRREWLRAVQKARAEMTMVDNIFPELEQQALVDQILERLRPFAGFGAVYKQIIGRLDDLEWMPEAVDQALAFLAEGGYLTWNDRRAVAGHPYRLFRFRPWPEHLAWDGVTREVPGRATSAPASIGP